MANKSSPKFFLLLAMAALVVLTLAAGIASAADQVVQGAELNFVTVQHATDAMQPTTAFYDNLDLANGVWKQALSEASFPFSKPVAIAVVSHVEPAIDIRGSTSSSIDTLVCRLNDPPPAIVVRA